MLKIIRGVFYQARRSLIVCLTALLGTFSPILMMVLDGAFDEDGQNAGKLMINSGANLPMVMIIVALIAGALVAGADFSDKTINFEILNGHKKWDIYFGRLVAAYSYVLFVYWCSFLAEIVVFRMMYPWGDNVTFLGILARYVVAMFPLLRFVSSVLVMTFLFRNPYISMLINYVLVGMASIGLLFFEAATEIKVGFLSSMLSMSTILSEFNSYLGFVDGQDVMIYETSFTGLEIAEYIGYSVLFCAGMVMIGYMIFKKLDMK